MNERREPVLGARDDDSAWQRGVAHDVIATAGTQPRASAALAPAPAPQHNAAAQSHPSASDDAGAPENLERALSQLRSARRAPAAKATDLHVAKSPDSVPPAPLRDSAMNSSTVRDSAMNSSIVRDGAHGPASAHDHATIPASASSDATIAAAAHASDTAPVAPSRPTAIVSTRRIRALSATAGVAGLVVVAALLLTPRVNDAVNPPAAPTAPVAYDALIAKAEPSANPSAPAPMLSSSLLDRRNDPEARMVRVLMKVSGGDLDSAAKDIDALLADTPNFRLAHLVKGDLLLARARALRSIGSISDVAPPAVRDLEEEARARMRRYTESLAGAGKTPRYLLQLGPQQTHAIVVDTQRSRLLVYAQTGDGTAQLVDDYYVTIGKNGPVKRREGDQRTPVGVYEVTATLDAQRLTDFYGTGAFPINYPNAWDQRGKRGGSGIWLHGVPSDTYSRPPRASNGCVVLSNGDLEALRPYLKPGVTPVVITDSLEWASADDLGNARAELQNSVEQWRKDWESRDTESYARHYHEAFRADGRGRANWLAQKRGANASKSWVNVQLNDLSILGYPGNEQLAVVTFEQDYRSNNYDNAGKKRQYWLREDGAWRIVYEGLDS